MKFVDDADDDDDDNLLTRGGFLGYDIVNKNIRRAWTSAQANPFWIWTICSGSGFLICTPGLADFQNLRGLPCPQ